MALLGASGINGNSDNGCTTANLRSWAPKTISMSFEDKKLVQVDQISTILTICAKAIITALGIVCFLGGFAQSQMTCFVSMIYDIYARKCFKYNIKR